MMPLQENCVETVQHNDEKGAKDEPDITLVRARGKELVPFCIPLDKLEAKVG